MKVVFDILEDSLFMSVCEIKNDSTKVSFSVNETNPHLHDTRMGAFKHIKCSTCEGNESACNGHFGHIKLAHPVFNPMYVENLRKVFRLFCMRCFNFLVETDEGTECTCFVTEKSDGKTKKRKRNNEESSKKRNPLILKVVAQSFDMHNQGVKQKFVDNTEMEWTIKKVYNLLKSIPLEKSDKMIPVRHKGKRIHKMFFLENLLVLPIALRPPNEVYGDWYPNQTTIQYSQIIKINKTLKTYIIEKKKDCVVNDVISELQFNVNILFDVTNTNKKLPEKVYTTGGLRQRINGKNGRIRGNLMGKRTNQCARTVLTGDPLLPMNVVGVPQSIADNLTFPEHVNRYNIKALKKNKRVRFLIRGEERFDLTVNMNILSSLKIGDILERCLQDGDVVVINRQPTLHRGSMLACRIKIMPFKTFRINLSTAVSLNADFDGDEINMFVPQDYESVAELVEFIDMHYQIVNSQNNAPITGLTQDALLGIGKLSVDENIDWLMMNELLMSIEQFNDVDKRKIYTGRDVIQIIIDHLGINFMNYNHKGVIFEDGKYVSGQLSKATVGAQHGSLIHMVYLRNGSETTGKFIHLLQLVARQYLDIVGFSIGISDCLDVNDTDDLDFDAVDERIMDDLMTKNKLPNDQELIPAMNKLLTLDVNEKDKNDNRLVEMITIGSKGSITNYNQIKRFVCQQVNNVGERIDAKFCRGTRMSPHTYKFCDYSLVTKGFVRNSYIKGLTPTEFFNHAIASRNDLISTACSTAETGYNERKVVKCNEDVVTDYDCEGNICLRKTGGDKMLIDTSYGVDNIDPMYKFTYSYNV